jgi:rhomboid protease GluP
MAQQKSVAILCPDCGQLISANAEVCIHCGRRNPSRFGLAPFLRRFLGDIGFTAAVTGFCIIVYAISLLIDPATILRPRGLLSILGPSGRSLDALGATGTYAMAHGRWWTLITAIYLHGGLLHIFFNLMWIRQLAPAVEEFFGPARLILIFTIAGVVGFMASNFMGIPFTIGASGSVFGLLGAVVYYGRSRGGAFGTAIFQQTLQWTVIGFLFGFFMQGINNWAHGGGFAGGYLAAMLLGYTEKRRETFAMQMAAAGAIGLTIVAFGMVAWNLFF